MPEVERDGIRVHYEVIGQGPPVLLMHGGYVSSEYWKSAGYVEALSRDHAVLLMDFRGHGLSSAPHESTRYGLIEDVSDAAAVLDAAQIEVVAACGWSWGGTTGLALASLHPSRVSAVVAISSSGRHGRFSDLPAKFEWTLEHARRFESEGCASTADAIERDGGRRWLREAVLANDPLALAAWCRGQWSGRPLGVALGDLGQPVVFMPGELEFERLGFPDPILPRHARVETIPGATHVAAFLRSDRVLPVLRELVAHASRSVRRHRSP